MMKKLLIIFLILTHFTLVTPLPELSVTEGPSPSVAISPGIKPAHAESIPANNPPVIDPIANMTVNEGDLVILHVNAYDPDGDSVTISYPAPFASDGTWQTSYRDAGTRSVTISVSDGALSSSTSFTLTVMNVNAPPTVQVSTDKNNIPSGTSFTITVLAEDPDGDPLRLTLKEDGAVIYAGDMTGPNFTMTRSINTIGNHTIESIVEEVGVLNPNTASDSLIMNIDPTTSTVGFSPISGDFNGDGLTDLGYYDRGTDIWKVAVSENGSFGAFQIWIAHELSGNEYLYPINGDFNADGKTDIGLLRVPTSDGARSSITIAPSDGTKFTRYDPTTGYYWRDTANGTLQSDWHFTTFTGDFNGDGLTDIGQIRVDNNQAIYIGLTEENLVAAVPTNWITGGSHVSMSDFTPLAGDFNGDGLTDLCLFKKSEGRWAVTLSKGNRFGDTSNWMTGFGIDQDPILGDFNFDGLTDIGYTYKENGQWSIKYALSDGTRFIEQVNSYQTQISDMLSGSFMTGDFNGDGVFDVALFDTDGPSGTPSWTVKLHASKTPDLLVSIDNGLGGKTRINYKDSVAYDNNGTDDIPDMPFSTHVVSEVFQDDGLGNSYKTSYFYENGFFEPDTREFRGFGRVEVIDAEGSHKETYFYQDDIRKGRPEKEIVRDKYNRLYSETLYTWQNRKLYSGLVDFPYLFEKTSIIYNPEDALDSKFIKAEYAYDDYGNVTYIKEYGFDGSLLKNTAIDYASPNTQDWIIGKPSASRIYEADGITKVQEARFYYDNLALGTAAIKGSLTKEERWLNLPINKYIATSFSYDALGNVERVVDARGNSTQTIYDATKTFPVSVTNALTHTQSFTYDKAIGKILTSTDPNGQVTTSTYDGFGRLVQAVGPGNISQVNYEYDLESTNFALDPAKIISTTKASATESVKAYSFVDGLGRQILSRVQAEYQGVPKHIVSGEVRYDSRGQVIKKYLPYYINAPLIEDTYIPPSNSTPFVSYEYDAMNRLVKVIRPDNKTSYIIYGVNKVESINENNQKIIETKDEYGRIIQIEEDTGSLTDYEYDILGNLTKTKDALGNITLIQYDSLGRKTSMTDPDMGGFAGKSWSYAYDDVGNLIRQIDAKDQSLIFEYDAINRLIAKKHLRGGTGPTDPSSEVVLVNYLYDDTTATKPNCIGRLSKVTDLSGQTEFFYDILGREVKTIKTVNTASYTIERTYDSLDRLVTVKYPDTTILTYTYNKQGGIKTVSGAGAVYVSNVDYNANGQITKITYGNGTSTDYTYDPYNFHLEELYTSGVAAGGGLPGGGAVIQHLSYNFDPVGNVTSILDSVHTNTQSFQYDNLNRLTQANGSSYGMINYTYNSIGNILTKGNLTMQYGQNAGPHAVTTLTRNTSGVAGGLTGGGTGTAELVPITYDHNGNMITKGSSTFEYDIENRLRKVIAQKGGKPFNISINLQARWNFISIPGFIPNTSGRIADILSSIQGKYEQVCKYDPVNGGWRYFVNNPRFNQFDTFEPGEGYLIYVTEPCTLNLEGNFPVTEQTKQLKTGWNLISAPTDSTIPISEALQGITYDSIFGYTGTGYTIPQTLEAGKSYWIHVPTDQTWTISLPKVETNYIYDGDGGRVLRQVTGEDSTLYIGSSFEAIGPSGQTATKQTKHIFMGSTRVCSIEVEDPGTPNETVHVYYYHQDHIGSSNVITNESGEIAQILEYSPYGEVARNTGNYSTDKRFTGKIYDDSSFLYYFGARYYDPELGRFITADPTIAHPFDPQDLNRYSYCRNNPVNYTDPTGLSWWSKFWQSIVGVVTTVISILAPPLAPAMMAINFAISAYTAIQSGNVLGLVGGIVGGVIFGAIGREIAGTISANMGNFAYTFAGGAIEGAIEFGLGGFGAGFGAALASGEKLSDSFRAGAFGAAVGAAMGAGIQGSYKAGWQNSLHGLSIPETVSNQARTGTYGEEYFKNLSESLSRRRNAWGIFRHYGYQEDAESIFGSGLRPGSYGSPDFYTSGKLAEQRLSITHITRSNQIPNARYTLTVNLNKTIVIPLGKVPAMTNPPRTGGGQQVVFPKGVPSEEISSMDILGP